jgi:hypothetical protein
MSFAPPEGQQLDVLGDAMPERLTVVERVMTGDWRGPALAAAAALLTAFVACQVALTTPLMFERGKAVPDHTVGNWLRGAAGMLGMVFGAPITQRYHGDDFGGDFFGREQSGGIAPLTITLLALGVLYVVLRRTARPESRQDAVARTVRTAVLFGGGVAIVSAFGRFAVTEDGSGTTIAVSWLTALVWATLAAGLVAAVAFRLWRRPVAGSLRATLSDWGLAARGGLVGLGTGLAISAVTIVAVLFAYSGRFHGAGNVAKSLPMVGAFLVNLATALFAVACGGRAGIGSVGFGDAYVSVFHRQGLSAAYLLLLLVPALSVWVAVRYVARHRGERSDRETVRACYRTAASATGVWFLLAVASQVRVSAGAFGFGGAGPNIGLGLLLTPMWFLLGGYLLGRHATMTVAAVPDREPRPRRAYGPPYATIVALAISGIVLTAVAAVALDGAPDEEETSPAIGRSEVVAPSVAAGFEDAREIAVSAGTAEEAYHASHGEYTDDPASLEPFGYASADEASVTITATSDTFCVQVSSNGDEYHYDSVDFLGEGLDCVV